jgi:hypothetical protein
MESLCIGPFEDPMLQPKKWVVGLENKRVLNLLEIPHFRWGKYVKNCVKELLAVLHG